MATHPLVLGLFQTTAGAASAAHALREAGVSRERVSIIAKTHELEGALADVSGGSPGTDIEDSRPAARLGELSAHLIAAIAVVMPGIGPIVADGPLAADLGEAAGHLAGGVGKALTHAGFDEVRAQAWESAVAGGAVLVGAHVPPSDVEAVQAALSRHGASELGEVEWPGDVP